MDPVKNSLIFLILFFNCAVYFAEGYAPRRIMFGKCDTETVAPKALFMKCANGPGTGDCQLIRGQTHSLRAVFIPEYDAVNVTSHVVWASSLISIPLPDQNPNACEESLSCPVVANKVTRFTYHLPIATFWFANTFPVEWVLTDSTNGNRILCFKFKIVIR